ncbi:Extracellular superoxide dismutase [Cu-Zn] [Collichthys lucidus]|uniref:Extracellular superoxide dismutase [Cu-Zn] n=1 Tax=Collichthys lucidus TaxID=240159 RepID=A0A4U5U2D6_COLLU|nr:Extracellular superoxide dismutase [Cu-Zn] [Collichthys lucidus]
MRPSTSLAQGLPKVYGRALFKQDYPQGTLKVLLRFNGFPTDGVPQARAVHIHQYGDLSQGCESTGGHYNPWCTPPQPPWRLGNFEPQEGKINAMIESVATLFGGLSVIGRAVVVHEKLDDLGRGGDAGTCCMETQAGGSDVALLAFSSPRQWNMHQKQYNRELRRN